MSSVNTDPVAGIRKAVASGMVSIGMQPNKELIDSVVDCLPDFFKQPLQAAGPTNQISAVAESAARLRTVDSYGFEWANLLQDKDTDPQMVHDVVAVVREYLRKVE